MRQLPFIAAAAAVAFMPAASSEAADGRYQMHFMAVLCTVAPCPDWQIVDTATGEKFYAVVDFSHISNPPPLTSDLLADGQRLKLQRPRGDGTYERFVVSTIVKATPAVPGYRP